MAQMIQFEDSPDGRKPLCIACEEMLADALDETLSPAGQAWFDRHISTCAECSEHLADAQRGAAWLEMLKTPRPEPSAMLLERIMAQTSQIVGDVGPVVIGQPVVHPAMLPVAMPIAQRNNLLSFRPRFPRNLAHAVFEPRLAMTAAMAFFSVALTLNLTGVRLDQIHASNLTPSGLKHTFYAANAEAVRYYDNLRVVRVMESRVDDLHLKGNDDDRPAPLPESKPEEQPAATPDATPEKKPVKKPDGGVSLRENPENSIDRPRILNAGEPISKRIAVKGGLA